MKELMFTPLPLDWGIRSAQWPKMPGVAATSSWTSSVTRSVAVAVTPSLDSTRTVSPFLNPLRRAVEVFTCRRKSRCVFSERWVSKGFSVVDVWACCGIL